MFYPLNEAIALHQKAKTLGEEILIFPVGGVPTEYMDLLSQEKTAKVTVN